MKKKIQIPLTLILIVAVVLYLFSGYVFGWTTVDIGALQGSNKFQGGQVAEKPIPDEINLKQEIEEAPIEASYIEPSYLEKTVTINEEGLKVVTNPNDPLVLANKERNLAADYEPSDLVYLKIPFPFEGESPIRYLRREAAEAIYHLFAAAKEAGINLVGKSGYRSYAIQKKLFAQNVAADGEEEANKFSARPGQSEHQTGLALDVTTAGMGYALSQSFGETEAGRWVAANAYRFGLIIRYTQGKEAITGYSYEPWHLRYVGLQAAKEITDRKITLEEYLAKR